MSNLNTQYTIDGVRCDSQFVKVNGIHLHVVTAEREFYGKMISKSSYSRASDGYSNIISQSPKDGKPLMLVHGFPDFWYQWRNQIGPLTKKGFKLYMPDMRGYNLSSKPNGVFNYKAKHVAKDLKELIIQIQQKDNQDLGLVSHDWGGVICSGIMQRNPYLVKKAVFVNTALSTAWLDTLLTNTHQLRKSWYVFYFLLPYFAENLFKSRNGILEQVAHTEDEKKMYKDAWFKESNTLSCMINYYRATFPAIIIYAILKIFDTLALGSLNILKIPKIQGDIKIIWGQKDKFLIQEVGTRSVNNCINAHINYYPNAGHWVMAQESDKFNQDIEKFFKA